MKKHYWTWPIATYLFLGGLGGGILLVTIILDLAFKVGDTLAMGVLVAIACLGIGCGLLIFELGQPKLAYRVVISNTAIIKYGALILSVAMVFGVLYYSFFLRWFPWTDMIGIRSACGVIAGVFGLFTMIYTGVLLASFKARAFWNSPALPVLFTVSALSTACAALTFCVGAWPSVAGVALMHEATELLHAIDLVLIPIELIVILVYLLLMRGASNVTSQNVAARWLNGAFAPLFWGGMVCGGLLIPLACYLIGGFLAAVVAPVLVLAGGLLLRFLIVYSDDRRMIPGEAKFYSRIPKGDEAFLTAWKR